MSMSAFGVEDPRISKAYGDDNKHYGTAAGLGAGAGAAGVLAAQGKLGSTAGAIGSAARNVGSTAAGVGSALKGTASGLEQGQFRSIKGIKAAGKSAASAVKAVPGIHALRPALKLF
jgi:hypothetical protein